MALMKVFALIFYWGKARWIGETGWEQHKDVRLMVFLNHTSLCEPIFVRFAPWGYVWNLAQKVVVPGADTTLMRPWVGKVLKVLIPGCIPITRKNDHSWLQFLSHVNQNSITAILPEGRMKRRSGLDKFGRPMTARGGLADILDCLNEGKVLFVYSGGLHHVQAPGEGLPKIFKRLHLNLEVMDIQQYKADLQQLEGSSLRQKVINDLNRRLQECLPEEAYQ